MLRERVAELLSRRAERLGIEPAVPLADVATMAFAMTNGMALEQMVEPETRPEAVYPEMMAIFFSGLRDRASTPQRP
jgi:hypothetical protein